MNKHCLEVFRAHWQCLDNNNHQLWQCRPAEWKLNTCVFNNLVSLFPLCFLTAFACPRVNGIEVQLINPGQSETRKDHSRRGGQDPRPPTPKTDLRTCPRLFPSACEVRRPQGATERCCERGFVKWGGARREEDCGVNGQRLDAVVHWSLSRRRGSERPVYL